MAHNLIPQLDLSNLLSLQNHLYRIGGGFVASPHRVSQAILVGADCFLLDFHKPIKSIGVIRLYQIVKYDNLYTGFNAY